jgi:hypothetical protein
MFDRERVDRPGDGCLGVGDQCGEFRRQTVELCRDSVRWRSQGW